MAVEGLLRGGSLEILAIFDKPDPLDGPYFAETIYVTPSRLPAPTLDLDRDERPPGRRAAIGLTEGPIHAELRVNERGAWVLEVAARSIGGLCGRTLRFGAGVAARGAHPPPRRRARACRPTSANGRPPGS